MILRLIYRKSTFSKLKAPTTVILRDSIVKNLYSYNITRSVKHKRHVVVKHFSGENADIYHYKKPAQEKSPAEIIIIIIYSYLFI